MEDVVESRVYVRVHSELRRQANKQTSDVALKVGANVGTEVVAKWIGQIVDEGNKPKDEPLAKIGSVGFEGIEPIGSKDDYITSGSQHPECLMQRLPIISQVLDDLVQEDYVDGVVVEGELLGGAGEEREAAFSAGAYPLPVDVYAVHSRAKLGESLKRRFRCRSQRRVFGAPRARCGAGLPRGVVPGRSAKRNWRDLARSSYRSSEFPQAHGVAQILAILQRTFRNASSDLGALSSYMPLNWTGRVAIGDLSWRPLGDFEPIDVKSTSWSTSSPGPFSWPGEGATLL